MQIVKFNYFSFFVAGLVVKTAQKDSQYELHNHQLSFPAGSNCGNLLDEFFMLFLQLIMGKPASQD